MLNKIYFFQKKRVPNKMRKCEIRTTIEVLVCLSSELREKAFYDRLNKKVGN